MCERVYQIIVLEIPLWKYCTVYKFIMLLIIKLIPHLSFVLSSWTVSSHFHLLARLLFLYTLITNKLNFDCFTTCEVTWAIAPEIHFLSGSWSHPSALGWPEDPVRYLDCALRTTPTGVPPVPRCDHTESCSACHLFRSLHGKHRNTAGKPPDWRLSRRVDTMDGCLLQLGRRTSGPSTWQHGWWRTLWAHRDLTPPPRLLLLWLS